MLEDRELQAGHLIALDLHGGRHPPLVRLGLCEARGLERDLGLVARHLSEHVSVVARDQAHLIDLLEQVVEAVCLHHHPDDVGRGRLVLGHQLGRQSLAIADQFGLERAQADAGGRQLPLELQ